MEFIVVAITIMLRRLLAESAGTFWGPAEFKNVANPDTKNLKHLRKSGYLLLTAPPMCMFTHHLQ